MTNEYVFPQDIVEEGQYKREGGLDIRDYFAAQALVMVRIEPSNLKMAAQRAAQVAYAVADAMLEERALPKGEA